MAALTEIERLQTKAAELILDDEGWRGTLEDEIAIVLVNGVLAASDAAIARLFPIEASAEPDQAHLEDTVYEIAYQSRALLTYLACLVEGETASQEPALLGPPLFQSEEEANNTLASLLDSARLEVDDQPQVEDSQGQDAP